MNSVNSDVLIPLKIIVSPSAIPCGIEVTPITCFFSSLSDASVNVVIPISTVFISFPNNSLTTMLAPVPFVPLLSNVRVSSILYPSPLENTVTDVIPALFVLVTSNSCFNASFTSSISS